MSEFSTPTLWVEPIGEPVTVWCSECEAHCATIANYAMGLGIELAGAETIFHCDGCGRKFALPDTPALIERRVEPAYRE